MRPRFTLAGLIVATLLCGAGFAALRQPTGLIAGLAFSATATALGVAILGALFLPRPARAFCAGAAIFGAGYLALALVPDRPQLPTAALLDWLFPKLHPTLRGDVAVWHTSQGNLAGYVSFSHGGRFIASTDDPNLYQDAFAMSLANYRTIGHSLSGLVVALVGGLIACLFAARRERRPEASGR